MADGTTPDWSAMIAHLVPSTARYDLRIVDAGGYDLHASGVLSHVELIVRYLMDHSGPGWSYPGLCRSAVQDWLNTDGMDPQTLLDRIHILLPSGSPRGEARQLASWPALNALGVSGPFMGMADVARQALGYADTSVSPPPLLPMFPTLPPLPPPFPSAAALAGAAPSAAPSTAPATAPPGTTTVVAPAVPPVAPLATAPVAHPVAPPVAPPAAAPVAPPAVLPAVPPAAAPVAPPVALPVAPPAAAPAAVPAVVPRGTCPWCGFVSTRTRDSPRHERKCRRNPNPR